jgi:hypothetical protein
VLSAAERPRGRSAAYTLGIVPRRNDIPAPPKEIVTFDAPPLNEAAIGVQFPGSPVDDGIALADFWPHVRPEFPGLERQMPLPAQSEDFEVPPKPVPPVQFFPVQSQVQRYWFVSSDETRLIQLQADRLVVNWRQRRAGDVYPRYRELRREFERSFRTLVDEALPQARRELASPEWCEVTYINHVDAIPSRGGGHHRPLSDVLRVVARVRSDDVPAPEDAQYQQRSLITGSNGEPTGRLYVAAQPAWRQDDGLPIYNVSLVARARPTESTIKSMFECFDHLHALIVRTFVGITTSTMHQRWKLTKAGT